MYVNFLSHCYIDTEVEVKEIYTSASMWNLFDNFLVDMGVVSITRLPFYLITLNYVYVLIS